MAEAVPSAPAAESLTVIAPPATVVSVARKRAAPGQEIAPSDDELIPQDRKSKKAPPHKKSRPAEVRFSVHVSSVFGIAVCFVWTIPIPYQPYPSPRLARFCLLSVFGGEHFTGTILSLLNYIKS